MKDSTNHELRSSGIGLAAAMKYAKAGMSIFIVDIAEPALKTAVEKVKSVEGVSEVQSMTVDVSKVDQVVAMREKVLDVFGEVGCEITGKLCSA